MPGKTITDHQALNYKGMGRARSLLMLRRIAGFLATTPGSLDSRRQARRAMLSVCHKPREGR